MKFNEIYFGNGLFTSQSGFQLTVSQKSATFNLILIFRCYCSVTKSYPTLLTPWTAACQVSLSFTISWNLHKFMSTESVMPSNHFILCCPFSSCPSPPVLSLSQLRVFSKVCSSHQLMLQLQHQSFQ